MKKILLALFLNLFSICYAANPEKVTVLLDWFANPDHAPLIVGKEMGFFKEEGIDVELIGPADPTDPPKLVAAGKADIAITYEPQFIEQIDRGLPLIRVGTLIDHPLNCLVVLKDSPIQSIADLKNKKVGSSLGGVTSVALETMLKKNGLNMNDIEHINVHYDLTQSLLSKKVDAVTGMMRNFELIQLELAGHPGRAFYPEKNGVPDYSELILVTRKNLASDTRIAKFVYALRTSVRYVQAHPEESWKIFAKVHPELNNELNHRAWIATIPLFAKDPFAHNPDKWRRFAEFMHKNGLIGKPHPFKDYSIVLMD